MQQVLFTTAPPRVWKPLTEAQKLAGRNGVKSARKALAKSKEA